jgi:hypothetical protein
MQESESLRIFVSKKGMIHDRPTNICMRNLWQKAEMGKKTGSESITRFSWASCFKKTRDVCQKYGGACTTYPWSAKGMRKQEEKLDSRAAKRGKK